jgi:hypothetical protein
MWPLRNGTFPSDLNAGSSSGMSSRGQMLSGYKDGKACGSQVTRKAIGSTFQATDQVYLLYLL